MKEEAAAPNIWFFFQTNTEPVSIAGTRGIPFRSSFTSASLYRQPFYFCIRNNFHSLAFAKQRPPVFSCRQKRRFENRTAEQ